jgi:hypothetical protein
MNSIDRMLEFFQMTVLVDRQTRKTTQLNRKREVEQQRTRDSEAAPTEIGPYTLCEHSAPWMRPQELRLRLITQSISGCSLTPSSYRFAHRK